MNTISRALKKAREAEAPPTVQPSPVREALAVVDSRHAPQNQPGVRELPSPPLPERPKATSVPLHLRDYIDLVLKRPWLFLGIALLVPAVTAVFTLRQTPEYFATAVLQVSRERVRLVEDITVDSFQTGGEFYATQLRLLGSKPFAERVTNRLRLWERPFFQAWFDAGQKPGPEAAGPIAETIRWWCHPRNVEGTQLLETSYSSPDPGLSADLANALADEYIAFLSESESGVAQNTASFLQEQTTKLQAAIAEKEKILAASASPDSRLTLATQRLSEMNSQLTAAEADRVAAQIRYETLSSQDPRTLPSVTGAEVIKAAEERYEVLRQQFQELSSRFGPEWPELVRVKGAMEEAEKRLNLAVQENAGSVINAARLEYENALKRETQLREQVSSQRYSTEQMTKSSNDFEAQRLELQSQKNLLEQLLRREREAGLTVDLGERPPVNARIVERASPPDRPYKPNVRKNLLLATAAGLCLALALAFFMDYWESTIDTPEQLRSRFSIPYLGDVPAFVSARQAGRWPWARRQEVPLAELYLALPLRDDEALDPVQRAIAERFRMIRTVLVSSKSPSRTILVTSPDARTGKTFVSCNLAIALAQLDKRVLLVDCDLRLPRLHEIFQLDDNIGLFDLLSTEEFLPAAFQPTEHPRLHVMVAGRNRDFPAERLSSPSLRAAIEQFARFYDYVVLDSAPLLPVPDSVSLAKCSEEVILVVRSRYTSQPSLQAALDIIERSNARVTGVILNGVSPSRASRSYAAYEYGAQGRT